MPLKNGLLTPQERTFVDVYATTGDHVYAARQAGYRGRGAPSEVMQRPGIAAAIVSAEMERFVREAVPLANRVVLSILGDERVPSQHRLKAAQIVHERADRFAATGVTDKELHEMTPDELANRIAQLRAEMRERAQVLELEAEPVTPESVNNTDLFS